MTVQNKQRNMKNTYILMNLNIRVLKINIYPAHIYQELNKPGDLHELRSSFTLQITCCLRTAFKSFLVKESWACLHGTVQETVLCGP